jgi:hypothetical protein
LLTLTEHCNKFTEGEQDTGIRNFTWVKQFQNGTEGVTADKISGSQHLELIKIWKEWSK